MPGAPSGLLEIGRIGRPHGLQGEVALTLSTDRTERVAPGTRWWLGSDGSAREVVVEASRPHRGRYLVRLVGIGDRTAAGGLTGARVFAEPLTRSGGDEGAIWVHEVIGAEVLDRAGRGRGRVVAVEANPAHDLLVLDGGGLVPMVFVVEQRAGVVVIDPPEGLLD